MHRARTNFARSWTSSFWPEWWHRRTWDTMTNRILAESERISTLSDDELKSIAETCRGRVTLLGFEHTVIVEVFALVREIAGRVYGLRHHSVQVLGALAMSHGWIAEMGTGEGKTLTSLMTIVLLALNRKGCHVFTANDYLASRDREFAEPLLNWFGLSSAVLRPQETDAIRSACYRADITYGSEKEFGFDFLRDRLNCLADTEDGAGFDDHVPGKYVQTGHPFAVIDEADSILIDQASTPLIISCPQRPTDDELQLFHWSDQVAGGLVPNIDYSMDSRRQSARLTRHGCRKLRLTQKPLPIGRAPSDTVYTQVERAIAARKFFRENQEYIIIDERVEIIDQSTGRILPGRKWRDGLHQAVEVQAGLAPSFSTGTAARVTLQSYLRSYQFLCGMTGTAAESRRELNQIYGLRLLKIPHHQPSQLRQEPSCLFATAEQKWIALIAELESVVSAGRAVLVGTTSITASEQCAALLRVRGLDVQVLHAKYDRDEAEIIRQAGLPRRITVATNMAGRGTDIKLHSEVRNAGGLHVILSEMNRSSRIDRQLAGRAARQGDPGSFQIFASLDDDLLSILGPKQVARMKSRVHVGPRGELGPKWIACFHRAQRLYERRSERERKQLQHRDEQHRNTLAPLGLDPAIEFAHLL